MSHWDFSRRPRGQQGTPPTGPSDTAYEPDPMLGADGAWAAQDADEADKARPAQDGWPAEDTAAENPWLADVRWPDGGGWPPHADGSSGEGWPPADDWDDDEGTAPYPLTYERDDFPSAAAEPNLAPAPEPTPPLAVPWEPWPPAAYSEAPEAAGATAADQNAGSRPGGPASAPPLDDWQAGFIGLGRPDATAADPGWPDTEPGLPGADAAHWDGDWSGRRYARRGGGRHWLVLAGVVVAGAAAGAAAVLLAGPSPAGGAGRNGQPAGTRAAPSVTPAARASASPTAATAGPLTLAQAKEILAGYTTANNNANAQRSDALLATIETGSSYAIDAGLYQAQQGTAPYPAFGPAQATYYIPRDEPATGPRWFVAQVANAFSSDPTKVTSSEYLLFTQSAPGGTWRDAVEPYLLSGASAPQIAVGADGLATAVSPDAASVAVAPAQLPAVTAASIDGTSAGTGQPTVAAPGNLADVNDQQFWQGKLPGGKVTDTHTPATGTAGQEFALQTADGGALVFYTDAAQVTITPPAGSALHLTIPGFYSAGQALSAAGVSYLEQFATYDPPAGGQAPTVIADYSGITGKS